MSETLQDESLYPPLSETTEEPAQEAATEPVEAVTETGGGSDQPPEQTAVAASEDEPERGEDEEDDRARNARLARALREEKRRARQLEAEAQVLRGQRTEQPSEQVEREIQLRAQQLAQQQQINERANEIYSTGVKEFGRVEFDESVKAVNETFGQSLMPLVIDTLSEIDHAEKLIQYLADNPDVADRIAALPPHRLGAALAREAAKVAVPKRKPVSKAPPPIQPIATSSSAEPETDIEKLSMEELARMWDKRDFERRSGMR